MYLPTEKTSARSIGLRMNCNFAARVAHHEKLIHTPVFPREPHNSRNSTPEFAILAQIHGSLIYEGVFNHGNAYSRWYYRSGAQYRQPRLPQPAKFQVREFQSMSWL